MASDDSRFSVSAEKYLERHDVLIYIEDSISQLLDHREENPKVNPGKFFSDYFSSVKEGNHVIFREFAYVSATQHNRACFVRTFWKCFRHIGRKGDVLSIREYHALLCLLCPDFPFPPVQKTARIILMEDALDSLISFTDFLYAFQVQFCYDEFLSRCAEVYKELQDGVHNSHDTVVVPTSEEAPPSGNKEVNGPLPTSDTVDTMQYYRALIPVCDVLENKAPLLSVLKDILLVAKKVTFYGFLMALAKSEALNENIGKLPNKSELLEMTDQELTSPGLRPLSGAAKKPPIVLTDIKTTGLSTTKNAKVALKPAVQKKTIATPLSTGRKTATTARQTTDTDDDEDEEEETDSDSDSNE